MFIRVAFVASLLLLLVGQVLSLPLPSQRPNVVERSPEPLDMVVVYARGIPSDIAVRSVNGKMVPFSKREEEELARRYREEDLAKRSVPEENAVKSDRGNITPFNSKRSEGGERLKARNFGRRR